MAGCALARGGEGRTIRRRITSAEPAATTLDVKSARAIEPPLNPSVISTICGRVVCVCVCVRVYVCVCVFIVRDKYC